MTYILYIAYIVSMVNKVLSMKCINCGAEVIDSVCMYCGTDYTNKHYVSGHIDERFQGKLVIAGEEIPVYMSDVEVYYDELGCFRSIDGVLHRASKIRHRTFTLVEY